MALGTQGIVAGRRVCTGGLDWSWQRLVMKKLLIIAILTVAAWFLIAKIVTGRWTAICG